MKFAVRWIARMATCGAGPNAPSLTYTVGGKQYVAIFVGGNNLIGATKSGDSIYAFNLP